MANTLRFKRGLVSGIPNGALGEPLFTTDTFDLYIGNGTGNTRFQKYIASGTTSQLLRGDGSLLTMPIVLTSPTNGQVLKFNGTNWVNDSDASGITGTGVAGQVAYWSGTNTQVGSNNLFWNNTNGRLDITATTTVANRRVGLNVASASASRIYVDSSAGGANWNSGFGINASGIEKWGITGFGSTFDLSFYNLALTASAILIKGNTNNVIIGSETDSGQRLQVTGDTLLKGSGNTSATTALTVQNSDGTNLLRVRNDQRIFGNIYNFGTVVGNQISPTAGDGVYNVNGQYLAALFAGFDTAGFGFSVASYNTSTRTATSGESGTLRIFHGFAPTSGNGTFTMLQATGTINQTGGANGITRGLYVNPTLTAAADWRSIETSNNSGWSYYGAGTANSYFGGSVGIGSMSLTAQALRIAKPITGSVDAFGVNIASTIQNDVTSSVRYFSSISSTQAASFTLTNLFHYLSTQATFGAGSTVTNQYAFFASSGLVGATNNYGFYGDIASGTGRWNLYMNGTAANYLNGNTIMGTLAADSGEKLQVNGTMRVTGASTFGGDMALNLNQNNPTSLTITNTSTLAAAQSRLVLTGTNGSAIVGKTNTNYATYKITTANDAYLYNFSAGDISILNDFATGSIKMAAGGSSTAHFTIASTGAATFSSTVTAASFIPTSSTIPTNGMYLSAANTLGFATASTLDMVIDASGNVGINTPTPSQRLDVNGTAKINNLLIASASPFLSGANLYTTDSDLAIGSQGSSRSIQFFTNSVSRLRIDNVGRVGIGMSPLYEFDVTGQARVSDAIAIGTTPDTNLPFKILKNINSTVGIRFENTSTSSLAFSAIQFGSDVNGGSAFGNLVYASSGITESGVFKPSGTSLINTGSGGLNLLAVSQPIRFFTSTGTGTERVRIKNEGHVRFVPLASAPTTNVEAGDVYYDSSTNKLRCYNGTTWNDLF